MTKKTRTHPLRAATKSQAAEFFRVARSTVDGWVARGCPVVHRPPAGSLAAWTLDCLAVADWLWTVHQVPTGPQVDAEAMCPADRKNWYEGEVRRLAIEETQSNLIPRADVERTVAAAFAVIAQTVHAMPCKVQSQGIDPAIAGHVESMLELELELEALAERLAKLTGVNHAER